MCAGAIDVVCAGTIALVCALNPLRTAMKRRHPLSADRRSDLLFQAVRSAQQCSTASER